VSSEPGLGGWLRSLHPGYKLVLVAVLGFTLFVGASWATAPPQDPGIADDGTANASGNWSEYDENATLLGLQGGFRTTDGYARLISGDPVSGDLVQQWQSRESWANFDVSPLSDGRVLTAFIQKGYTDCGEYGPECPRTGFRIYDVENDTIDREWTFPVDRTHNSEVHDVEMLPNGEVLVVDMAGERVFAVDQSGEITWQWNASERYNPPADPESRDWLHMNDVDAISEDRYLVSVRNANQLVILERGEGVVEVINEDDGSSDDSCTEGPRLVPDADGDVKCGDPGVMREQHNPQWIGDGYVLVADSGNDRIVVLRRDDEEWEVFQEYEGVDGTRFNWPRDADLLENGNILVTDTFNSRVVEMTWEGRAVWKAGTGRNPPTIPYEADRLPHGEYAPGVLNGSVLNATIDGNVSEPPESYDRVEIPGITLLFNTLVGVGVVPIPYWATQWHLVGLLIALLASAVGTVWGYRGS
jgi:hypothetical protein